MKLNNAKAILIGSFVIALAVLARIDDISLFVAEAQADVVGMSHHELRRDRDFKKAVQHIVENCTVNGYVDSDYLYDTNISC